MISLQELIPKIQQARENQNTYQLSILADQALEATLDEKLIKSGSLQWLANRLSEVINEFEETDICIDDLRYRLAHLYMRSQKWKEADIQLLGIKDYLHNEAQIYSALCAFKQKDKLDSIQANIKRIAKELCNSKGVRTKSIQEQHYDLLEMLVYAADIDHSILDSYYKRGSTKADLQIRYFDHKLNVTSGSSWQPIARFRLIHLLKLCKKQGFLILDLRDSKFKDIEEFTTYIKPPSVKRLAEILADTYPQSISFDDLKGKLEEFRKPELRARLKEANKEKEAKEKANLSEQCGSAIGNEDEERDTAITRISEWKGKLCNILKEQSGRENSIIVHGKTYRLKHSFILVEKRSRV